MAMNALIAQGVRPIGADLPQIAGMLQDKRQADTRNALMKQQADQQNELFKQGQTDRDSKIAMAAADYVLNSKTPKDTLHQLASTNPQVESFLQGVAQQHGIDRNAITDEMALQMAGNVKSHFGAQAGVGPAAPEYSFENVNGHLVRVDKRSGTGTEIGNYASNKLSAPVAGIDPKTKMPTFMRYPENSTDGIPVSNQLPVPARPRQGMSVTTADGTSIQIGGDGTPVDLSKATRTNLESQFVSAQANLGNISDISAQWKPEFSTWAGQGKQLLSALRDKSGIEAARLSPEDRAKLSDFSTWKSSANSALSAYLNQLSGAAISPNEEKRLRAGFPNDEDGPTEFKAKVDATAKRFAMVQARAAYLLANPSIKMDSVSIDGMQGIILGEANKLAKAYTDRGMSEELARQRAITETRGRFGIGNAK